MKKLLILYFLSLTLLQCAGSKLSAPPENWVEKTLSEMTVEEKIGQMLAPAFSFRFYNESDPTYQRMVKLVKEYHIGGAMFYRSDPYAVARNIEKLQSMAKIPLLMMADIEWGITMRINDGTDFLQNMAVGATGDEKYAYQMGFITAQEAKVFGVHVGYAPVMDVNNNPDNVIINTRSYGEDPATVARLGSAFIRGMQDGGVFATAKHFPGHGNTDVDSHLGLPVITASAECIRSTELPPFQAAIDAGVRCIMVSHITFSAYPQMQGRPASIDPYFVTEVLRKEMGFKGLIVTDAMDMRGITNHYWGGDAAVQAINAGVDMVLIPPMFESTYRFVVEAAKSGRIPLKRIDESVSRILQAKFEQGLYRQPKIDLTAIEAIVAKPDHLQKADEIAEAAVTLLRDDKHTLPLPAEKLNNALVVTITDRKNATYDAPLNREIAKRIPNIRTGLIDPRTTVAEAQQLFQQADSVDAVIAGIFVTWGSYKGSVSLPDSVVRLIEQLLQTPTPLAVVSFGSPYEIRKIPQTPSYLCAYGTGSVAIRAATKALFGEIPITGKLPVSIPGIANIGDGIEKTARHMVLQSANKDTLFAEAFAVLETAMRDSIFPGAQVAIVHDGKLLVNRGFGHQTYDPASPKIDTKSIYDLASVTKVIATTISAMRMWENNQLELDIPISSYLPKFTGGLKDKVTMRHLLTHSGGLHWWAPLWEKATNKQEALEYIYSLPLDYTPGDSMIYSDLGLILAGEVLRVISSKEMDELAADLVFKPLGLQNTMYNPPRSLLPRIVPTEIGGSMNRGLIHGEVHDENTFFLDGVSSHAGLFSTAEDLAVVAQMLLNGGIYAHKRLLTPSTIRYWTKKQNIPAGSSRALGWDTPTPGKSTAGDYFGPNSFGHTGFTGTSIWVEPDRKVAIILLTNRVHPSRKRGGIYQVRRAFHNAVMKALFPDIEKYTAKDEDVK
jgi:beta-glucosidase-like glycosyl hydrolase/CubicO group peptidase (beta-lactamase class C family)